MPSFIYSCCFLFCILLSYPSLYADAIFDENYFTKDPTIATASCLYSMQHGDIFQTIESYKNYSQQIGRHDLELVQQIGFAILAQGARSRDPETQLMTLFGAGISMNEKVLYILEEGVRSQTPELQLVALGFLADLHSDSADMTINKAMSSPYVQVRFEAANYLVKNHYPTAASQVECLMSKINKELHPLFPQFFAQLGDTQAIKSLRRQLNDPNEKVRIAAILSCAKYGCDGLLPQIRALATHHHTAQQEACAYALGELKDDNSLTTLEALTESGAPSVSLAAWYSLLQLGRENALFPIQQVAQQGNLFAINLLGHIPGQEDFLFQLLQSNSTQVRINATLALLERQDPRCLPSLYDIVITDTRDLAFINGHSIGLALTAWKMIPSASQIYQENPIAAELACRVRESLLSKVLDLPEKCFLEVANVVFMREQNALIPHLVVLLENIRSPDAIALLKKYQQKVGAPLIRHYCNLALYRIKEPGPYEENLWQLICQQQHVNLIRFKPLMPWETRQASSSYQLTPEETSRVLIESLEAMAKNCDTTGISALLHVIQNGNEKNIYALAGLLIRAAE